MREEPSDSVDNPKDSEHERPPDRFWATVWWESKRFIQETWWEQRRFNDDIVEGLKGLGLLLKGLFLTCVHWCAAGFLILTFVGGFILFAPIILAMATVWMIAIQIGRFIGFIGRLFKAR